MNADVRWLGVVFALLALLALVFLVIAPPARRVARGTADRPGRRACLCADQGDRQDVATIDSAMSRRERRHCSARNGSNSQDSG